MELESQINRDGAVYDGYYNDGQKNGEWCFKLTDGAKYDGECQEDRQEGCTLMQKLIFIYFVYIYLIPNSTKLNSSNYLNYLRYFFFFKLVIRYSL